jgi:hypothetical protein
VLILHILHVSVIYRRYGFDVLLLYLSVGGCSSGPAGLCNDIAQAASVMYCYSVYEDLILFVLTHKVHVHSLSGSQRPFLLT